MKTYATGAFPSPPDARDYRLAAAAPTALPAKYMTKPPPVVDQGYIGNCVAQACCYVSRAVYGKLFSPNWLYGRRKETDYQGPGWYIREALKTMLHEGNVPDQQYAALEVKDVIRWVATREKELLKKAAPFTIDAFARLSTAAEIKQALYDGLLVVFLANITTYEVDADGIYHSTTNNHGCHAMSVWGWQDNLFRVLNSWGPDWGDGGMCWMHATDVLRLNDVWAIADSPNDLIQKPEPEKEEKTVRESKYVTGVGAGKLAVLRAEKEITSDKVGTIKDGALVTVLAVKGKRALITTGLAGWMDKKYLADKPPDPLPPDIGSEPDGEDAKLQWYLHKWGFGALVGEIDGRVGPKTKAALKQFQAAMGLVVDAIAGPKTWAALNGPVIVPRIAEADMTCQCGKYCDGWPNAGTPGVRLLVERIWRSVEKTYPGVTLYIANNAHPTPNGAVAGGQRCKQWNKDRGGATDSQHLYGMAADIYGKLAGVADATLRQKIEDVAMSLNVSGGVGYGATYIVHVDVRGKKARWKY